MKKNVASASACRRTADELQYATPRATHSQEIQNMCRRLSIAATFVAAVSALLFSTSARAEVKPHALFTDNMVLQRDKPVKVWGTAGNDERVKVSVAGQSAEATAKDGKWRVELKPLSAGGPH